MTTLTVSSGVTETGGVLNSGDQELVLNGGTAISAYVMSGAIISISSGGLAENVNVSSLGGTVQVLGGTVSSTTFAGSGLLDLSQQGGLAVQTILGSGSEMLLGSSAVASSTAIYSFAVMSNAQGTSNDAQVYNGGLEVDGANSNSLRTILSSGAEEYAGYGATTSSSVIESGGIEVLLNGAIGVDSNVMSGGKLIVLPGGSATGTVTDPGGVVQSGGIVEFAGQVVVEATIGAILGGQLSSISAYILSGGQLDAAAAANATLEVYSGGVTSSADLAGGAIETVQSGGVSIATMLDWDQAGSGNFTGAGAMTVLSGGSAVGTVILSPPQDEQPLGAAVLTVLPGAMVSGTVVNSGGLLALASGAIPLSTEVFIGGEIDLSGVPYDPDGSASVNTQTDMLTLTENQQATTLSLFGNYVNEYFHLSDDGGDGTLVTASGVPCFCMGTRILTDEGEVEVEKLCIGDLIVTKSGVARPLCWIGRRSYSAASAAGSKDIAPVRFRSGSLSNGSPKRDLRVSPMHAMFLGDALIPAFVLVNGSNVIQEAGPFEVHYFHLELETHEIIFAEGAATETYIDEGNRRMFDNAAEHAALHPFPSATSPAYCAPRLESGRLVESLRRGLAGGSPKLSDGFAGVVDRVDPGRVVGWAIDSARPYARQQLRILLDGRTLGQTLADVYRGDLEERGLGDGRHGFDYVIPGGITTKAGHVVEVQRASDGTPLHCSPYIVERFADRSRPTAPSPLRGCLDLASLDHFTGWADNPKEPNEPVELQILDNGALIAVTLANGWRRDLAVSRNNGGWCGFDVVIPGGLSPALDHVITVQRSSDGIQIPGSPVRLPSSDSFDQALRRTVKEALGSIRSRIASEDVLSFLAGEMESLRQRLADSDSRQGERLARDYLRKRFALKVPVQRGRALVIDPRYPDSGRDAGSVALLSHIRSLQRLGYDVSFVAADEMSCGSDLLASAGVDCWHKPSYNSVEELLRRQRDSFDLVYLHRVHIASAYMALARRHMAGARIIFSVADLHHHRLAGQARLEGRLDLRRASERVKQLESFSAFMADAALTHSSYEAGLLRTLVPSANVHVVRWDTKTQQVGVSFAQRSGVAFVGNYNHAPNLDAVRYLLKTIMPLVWLQVPELPCFIAGSEMPEWLYSLSEPRVRVLGHVASLGEVWQRVRVSIAPLRFGAGLKAKVLESFAVGIPCIMTPSAAEGFDFPRDMAELVQDSPEVLASLIVRLDREKKLNKLLSCIGLDFVEAHFGCRHLDASLQAAIDGKAVTSRDEAANTRSKHDQRTSRTSITRRPNGRRRGKPTPVESLFNA